MPCCRWTSRSSSRACRSSAWRATSCPSCASPSASTTWTTTGTSPTGNCSRYYSSSSIILLPINLFLPTGAVVDLGFGFWGGLDPGTVRGCFQRWTKKIRGRGCRSPKSTPGFTSTLPVCPMFCYILRCNEIQTLFWYNLFLKLYIGWSEVM